MYSFYIYNIFYLFTISNKGFNTKSKEIAIGVKNSYAGYGTGMLKISPNGKYLVMASGDQFLLEVFDINI